MKMLLPIAGVAVLSGMMTGCATVSPEECRAAYQNEYARLAALPPAEVVSSPNFDVSNCARLSCDLFNEVHPLMKAYVDKTESSREYIGFMNDIQYYVKEEKMSEQDACKKVIDDVMAADATRPDDQKLWPKIQKGIAAVNELDPKNQLVKIAVLTARNLEIDKSVKTLPKSFRHEDFMGMAQRVSECAAISKQLTDAAECLTYLSDQYSRVIALDNYAR